MAVMWHISQHQGDIQKEDLFEGIKASVGKYLSIL